MEKPRVKGHSLTWLGVTRCLCECGTAFSILPQECSGRKSEKLRDELMDKHSNHIQAIKFKRQRDAHGEVE